MAEKTKKVLRLDKNKDYTVVATEHKKKKQLQFFSVGLASEIGYSIAIPIIAGAFLGKWIDERFSSQPRATLSGIFIGIFFSFLSLFRVVSDIIKKDRS